MKKQSTNFGSNFFKKKHPTPFTIAAHIACRLGAGLSLKYSQEAIADMERAPTKTKKVVAAARALGWGISSLILYKAAEDMFPLPKAGAGAHSYAGFARPEAAPA